MLNKDKFFLYCDRAILTALCLLIFCLPFSKAGAETFTWLGIFIFLLKRTFGYRTGSAWDLFPKTKLNTALGIFILINVLSVALSANFGVSLRGFLGKTLKFLAIYLMLVEAINSRKRLKVVLIAVITSAFFIILDAGVMYFKGVDFLRGHNYGLYPFCASFSNASGFAGWLIVIIPTFIGIIASGIIKNLKLKILLSAAVVIQLFYLLKTSSRGGWLGFLIGILLIVFYLFKISSLKIKALSICSIIGLLFISLLLPRSLVTQAKYYIHTNIKFSREINQRIKSISEKDFSINTCSIRMMLWNESLKIIRDYPWLGCGLNSYSIVAKKYKSFVSGGVYPHNSYLQMAAEIGLLGLLAFLWVLCSFFKIGMQYFNKKRDYLVLGLLSGILAFLAHAFFDTHLYSLQLVVLFWYMLGLTVAIIEIEPPDSAARK